MGLIRYLFMERKHLAYTAFGQDMYFKACHKLDQHGVNYDVARKSMTSLFDTSGQTAIPSTRNQDIANTQYDFYVKQEDEHRAQGALR